MERMNYINKDKNYMTDEERIRHLEESIRELRKEKENLKKEKGVLKARLEEENKTLKDNVEFLHSCLDDRDKSIAIMQEENKKLNEFKTKREESMFYFKAQMERAETRTAKEAEDLQRAKEIFEKLYRKELNCLEEENKKLKSDLAFERTMLDNVQAEYKSLQKIIKNLKEENEELRINREFDKGNTIFGM